MALDDLMAQMAQSSFNTAQRRVENRANIQTILQAMANSQIKSAGAAHAQHVNKQGIPIVGGSGRGTGPGTLRGLVDPIKGFNTAIANTGGAGDYGPRINPVTGEPSFHTGMDLSVGTGTPIRAVQAGIIKKAHWDDIYGNQVIIGHGGGYRTMYGHQNRFIVKKGQHVKRGQIIGYVGSTGWATGPHLHFETWIHKHTPVNPWRWLRKFAH
jgi:Membrane proteins related to metalloendopeptidases